MNNTNGILAPNSRSSQARTVNLSNNDVQDRFGGETPQQIARHRGIARRYAWLALQASEKREDETPARRLARLRLPQLERLFDGRYGGPLPDDDAGLDDLTIALHHIAHVGGETVQHMIAWTTMWAPWLPEARATELAKRIAAKPRLYGAKDLGERLRLTDDERFRHGITTIRSIDPAEDPAERKRRLDRERGRRRRAEARAAREADPKPVMPWEAEGISRSTWYRRQTTGNGGAEPKHETKKRREQGLYCSRRVFVPPSKIADGLASNASAREVSGERTGLAASNKPTAFASPKGPQEEVFNAEDHRAVPRPASARAESLYCERPFENVIEQAFEINSDIGRHRNSMSRAAVHRLIERKWRQTGDGPVDQWLIDDRVRRVIEEELAARDRFRARRANHFKSREDLAARAAAFDESMVLAMRRRRHRGKLWKVDTGPATEAEIVAAHTEARLDAKAEAATIRKRDARAEGVTKGDLARRHDLSKWLVAHAPVQHPLRQAYPGRDAEVGVVRQWCADVAELMAADASGRAFHA